MPFTCEDCGKATAIWRCGECAKSYCATCNATVHAKGQPNAVHKRVPIAQQSSQCVLQELLESGQLPTGDQDTCSSVLLHTYVVPATVDAANALPRPQIVGSTEAYLAPELVSPEKQKQRLQQQIDSLTNTLAEQMNNLDKPDWKRTCMKCNLPVTADKNLCTPYGQVGMKGFGVSDSSTLPPLLAGQACDRRPAHPSPSAGF
jgi:hypothetical protein